jgi:hypothetical protein
VPGQCAEQGGLAATGRAENAHELARLDGSPDLHGFERVTAFAQAIDNCEYRYAPGVCIALIRLFLVVGARA